MAGLFGDSMDFLQKALGGTAKTAIGLGGALLTGQQNLTAYSGALRQNTDAFGKLGGAVGQVVDGLAKFAEASLGEYQALTGIGATFGKEIKDIKVSAAELGLTVEEMTGFLKSNATRLRAFGGTTDEAMARFKALSNTILDSRELGTELRRLGFTTKDINEGLALYGELTDANSRRDRLSVQQQAESAKNLMVELDGLAKLTGKQRDQLADEMRDRRRQGDVNAFLMGKNAEEQKAFVAQLTELQAKLGDDAANAFVDVALRGAPTTDATRNAMLAMGDGADELYSAAAAFNRGDMTSFQDSLRSASAAAVDYQNSAQFRDTAILGGVSNVSSAFANASTAAFDYKNAIDSTKDGTMSAADAEKQIREQIEAQQLTQMETVTGALDKTIDIQENLRKITVQVMEETIPHIENVAIAALEKMQAAMPSADEIANGITKGVNSLFQVAGLEDREAVRNEIQAGTSATQDVMAATQEAGANIVNSNVEAGQQTTEKVESTADTTQKEITDARASLEALQKEQAQLVTQGFKSLDPPMQAIQDKIEAAKAELNAAITKSAQAYTQSKIDAYKKTGRIVGGFAEGGRIPSGGYGLVGEAGPEFISGPANVMSAKTSMGVMQTLMKSIRGLDSSVQESQTTTANQISNAMQSNVSQSSRDDKFDTMITLLSQLVQVESMDANTQKRIMKATKGLQGNLLRGV